MHAIVTHGGIKTYFHSFLASGLAFGKWLASRPVYVHRRSPQYLLNRWLGEPQLWVWMLCTRDKL